MIWKLFFLLQGIDLYDVLIFFAALWPMSATWAEYISHSYLRSTSTTIRSTRCVGVIGDSYVPRFNLAGVLATIDLLSEYV